MCTVRARTTAISAVVPPRLTTTASAGPATKASTAQKVSSNDHRPFSWSVRCRVIRYGTIFQMMTDRFIYVCPTARKTTEQLVQKIG